MTIEPIRIATRRSELAIWQANQVGAALCQDYELVLLETRGDIDAEALLTEIGGQGVFVKEIQQSVLLGRADIAVHSAKDLPSKTPDGLCIAGFLPRGDVRDALVGSTVEGLRLGAKVATGSARRKALLLSMRPDLEVVALRGNIRTRLGKLESVEAILVANAALIRLEIAAYVTQVFEPEEFCPQVAQGAIALEARSADNRIKDLIAAIDDFDTRVQVSAERAMLSSLGASCSLPIGAYSSLSPDGITLYGMVASQDGSEIISALMRSPDPERLGSEMGRYLLDAGGDRLLLAASH